MQLNSLFLQRRSMNVAIKAVVITWGTLGFSAPPEAPRAQPSTIHLSSDRNAIQKLKVLEKFTIEDEGFAAISPDGQTLAYAIPDEANNHDSMGLHVKSVETGVDKRILSDVEGLTRFGSLSFSPDGSRILFSVGGVSYYYSTWLCSIRPDGSDLVKIDNGSSVGPVSAPTGYVSYDPAYSPDGSKIAMKVITPKDTDYIGLLSADAKAKDPKRLTKVGESPYFWFWSMAGDAIYYTEKENLRKFVLSTRKSRFVMVWPKILSRIPGADAVFLKNGSVATLPTATKTPGTLADTAFVNALGLIPLTDEKGRTLTSIQAALSAKRLLLTYYGGNSANGPEQVNCGRDCYRQHALLIEYQ